MGAKDSKRQCLSYEDAAKRVSDAELKRVCEAFKRLSGGGQLMSQGAFTQHVLGEGVPHTVAGSLYAACGGTARGIGLRDLVCGLVLLTKGTHEEKIRFLWTLYCNDSGTHISRSDFQRALQLEGAASAHSLPPSLFGAGQERAGYDEFRAWIIHNVYATVLSRWLLTEPCVSLSTAELDTPTFYQTLAGVTHLEETDICDLEKCFWVLQAGAASGQLDLPCVSALVSPPVPASACPGLFHALDVNRDGHIDFKELCCGVSAACRGPIAERVKFCFKMFDMDRDGKLNEVELRHMLEVLTFVAKDHQITNNNSQKIDTQLIQCLSDFESALETLAGHLADDKPIDGIAYQFLGQEEFVMWGVPSASLVHPMLELLFQVCHVSLGLRPRCRHHEHDIVRGWLDREEKRGYRIGQFWYLVSSEWWRSWLAYTSYTAHTAGGQCPGCGQRASSPAASASADRSVEEGIACDESFTSNSTESMGDLLKGAVGSGGGTGDTCSIASSSGVSSSSGSGSGQVSTLGRKNGHPVPPGPIDNTGLVAEAQCKVATLTGEGGRLRRDRTLVQHRDFELLPDSLWKALAHWYGGPLPLPRQVIKPPGADDVDLELYPLNLRILRHQAQSNASGLSGGSQQSPNTWGSVVGGYGAAALSSAGLTAPPPMSPRRYLAHTAAFSRLATVGQVLEFLSQRLGLRTDDLRLWHVRESNLTSVQSPLLLLDDDRATLQDVGVKDADQVLLEVRNADLTWPEELGALVSGARQQERTPAVALPAGATGLHNLGNTCFMNAALQAVSNTKPLTMYFRRDARLCELNQSNPLGTRGQVARRYAELCRELWTGTARSVAPLKLRWCVARHAPHLGGGGQHDSQELLAWLLDALHEDLNRVTGKHYTELSDSAGRPDAIVAAEAWKQHLARDHSVITDLFYGQLKSKVTCQTCGHESVRFDAFNVLSLPLPMDSYTLCEVLVVKLDGTVPTRYGVRLNSEARYAELKERLQRLCGVPAHRLVLAEVAESQIRQVLGESRRVNAVTALELLAYELGDAASICDIETPPCSMVDGGGPVMIPVTASAPGSPRQAARSPEVSNTSALCMPNILCFKNQAGARRSIDQPLPMRTSIHHRRNSSPTRRLVDASAPGYVTAVHRKSVRQDAYFVAQHRTRPVLFGVPLLLACGGHTTCQDLYEAVWTQVTRLLSPLPQSDQTNHAQDCDDSLGYEFPFTLRAVAPGGQTCALCPWTKFCRGCSLPCGPDLVNEVCEAAEAVALASTTTCNRMPRLCIAIDWDPTALHLRYQSCRERTWLSHDSVATCRRQHTEPVDLDHCLRAFTSEESLETRYHCSTCQDKQPATKKLQIWRLPPILIIHLKRFDYVNAKWVKTHKVVNFPFKEFDPTAYLASVPQETILRHRQLRVSQPPQPPVDEDGADDKDDASVKPNRRRDRLESTSLLRTPVLDENLEDFHMHHLQNGQNAFELKYQLYAVVSHSGMLNGGHYVSYAANPNNNWYCYNDSSCREVTAEPTDPRSIPKMDTSSAYMLFYERVGLDYGPYLPDVPPGQAPLEAVELDESESELRKQLCALS